MEITIGWSLLWFVPTLVLAVGTGLTVREALDVRRTNKLGEFLAALFVAANFAAGAIAAAAQI